MTKRNQDFVINEGDSVVIEDTVENKDGTTRDLTNHDAQVTVATYKGGPIILQYDQSDSRLDWDRSNGIVEATLESTDTENFCGTEIAEVYYEIELLSNNTSHTVTTGHITTHPSY